MLLPRALLIGLVIVQTAVAKEVVLCQKDLPLAKGHLTSQVDVEKLSFSSTTQRSILVATVTLSTAKPLSKLFMLVEILDESAKPLLSIPLVAETRGELVAEAPSKLDLFINTRKELENPALPGQSLSLIGDSQYVLLGCPSGVRVSMLDIHYSDGTSVHEYTPGWTLQSDIHQVQHLDVPSKGLPSRQYLVSVSLDRNGRVTAA